MLVCSFFNTKKAITPRTRSNAIEREEEDDEEDEEMSNAKRSRSARFNRNDGVGASQENSQAQPVTRVRRSGQFPRLAGLAFC